MIENVDLKKLIGSSFLSENNKRYLMQYLELKGVDTRFFDLFNTYLKEETISAKKEFLALQKEIEARSVKLEEDMTAKKMAIEEKMEIELSDIDPADIDNKERLWDEYYQELDTLGEIYQNELRKIVTLALKWR